MESSHPPIGSFVAQPPTPSTPGPSGIFVCTSDAMPLNLAPHHNHNNHNHNSTVNPNSSSLNANIPQSSTPSTLSNDMNCHVSSSGSCSRGQQSPPPQASNPQRLVSVTNMYTPTPQASGPTLQSGPHHVAAEVLVDPNVAFQSEVIIHSTPDTSHSHLHHHVHQHHYHPQSHPPRVHFGVSPPGFHISISPAGMVPPVVKSMLKMIYYLLLKFDFYTHFYSLLVRELLIYTLQYLRQLSQTFTRTITISGLCCRVTCLHVWKTIGVLCNKDILSIEAPHNPLLSATLFRISIRESN